MAKHRLNFDKRRNLKAIIKLIVPPIITSIFRAKPELQKNVDPIPGVWTGDYNSWEEAKTHCTGYDDISILYKCKNALLQVKNGEAAYERDSVLFDEIQYNWGLLAGLQKTALENNGNLCILDFGGSLGSTYYQNRGFLNSLRNLQWCIVEQPHFVTCGKDHFENDQLKFYNTLQECMTKHKPQVLLLSSILQYLATPYDWVKELISLNIPCVIIDRTAFINSEIDILTVQNVPKEIYTASYPCWFFGKQLLVSWMKSYKITSTFHSLVDTYPAIDGKPAKSVSYILEKRG
jgi:putative methyltransferase (TIGR04325 family)